MGAPLGLLLAALGGPWDLLGGPLRLHVHPCEGHFHDSGVPGRNDAEATRYDLSVEVKGSLKLKSSIVVE